jgi:hypothetical protein
MDTLLVIILGWIVLSIPVSLLIGRFLAGNRRTADVRTPEPISAQPDSPVPSVFQRSEPQRETAYSEMFQVSKS